MIPSPYSEDALKGCFRVGDSSRWKVDLDNDLQAISVTAAHNASAVPPILTLQSKTSKSGVVHYFAGDIETDLILRATYRRLAQQYDLRLPNRDAITSGILEAVSEGSPYTVTRCDIRSFYESTDARPLLSSIVSDTRTDASLRNVVNWIFDPHGGGVSQNSVPRGLALSTVLAELSLREFDKTVRKISGVHRYFRFADDIIIFSVPNLNLRDNLQKLLPHGLEFNEKTLEVYVQAEKPPKLGAPTSEVFDFLGYSIEASNHTQSFRSREFSVSVSSKKLTKRRTRVILALKAFQKNKDSDLLVDRLVYLSSNHSVYKTKHSRGSTRQKVRTGIYYNYPKCGFYAPSKKGKQKTEHHAFELVALDGFLKALLFGPNSEFSKDIASLSEAYKLRLNRISFARGYKKQIVRRFSRARMKAMYRVWGDE